MRNCQPLAFLIAKFALYLQITRIFEIVRPRTDIQKNHIDKILDI